jgi:hypothetical protein
MFGEDSLLGMVIRGLLKWLKTRHAVFSIVGTFVLFALLAYIFAAQANAFPAKNPYNANGAGPDISVPDNAEVETISVSGYAREGQPIPETFDLQGERIWGLVIELTFLDEPNDVRRRFTNTADSFVVTANFPDGTSQDVSGAGSNTAAKTLTLAFDWTLSGGMDWRGTDTGATNSVDIEVLCDNAGDQTPFFSPFNFRTQADNGNDYTLSVLYIYTPEE